MALINCVINTHGFVNRQNGDDRIREYNRSWEGDMLFLYQLSRSKNFLVKDWYKITDLLSFIYSIPYLQEPLK